MAKIGIVTFHRAHNYGAVLQCLALQEAISGLKHDTYVIDHINGKLTRSYPNGSLRLYGTVSQKIKRLFRHVLMSSRIRKRFNSFDRFIKSNYRLANEGNDKFDVVVYGSDQIWNDSITEGDPFFWGDGIETKRKIGYAVSAGNREKDLLPHLTQIRSFSRIGVRENSLKSILTDLGIQNVSTVLDPTLLLDHEKWSKLLNLPTGFRPKKYLVVYSLRGREKTLNIARRIASHKGLELIEIGASISLFPKRNRKELVGPAEFVELIKNASYVVTDSFHGTVFSIIFNRPFVSVDLEDGHDGRVANILHKLGLSGNHLTIHDNYDIDTIGMYDGREVDDKLAILRKESIKFLSSNLES